MKLPKGFTASGISAGLKRSGRPDLGLIVADEPVAWAFVGTTNALEAACVTRNRELYAAQGAIRGVVVNSGQANCATGVAGAADNERYAASAAASVGADATEFLTASTGVIGVRMPMSKVQDAMPGAAAALEDDVEAFAKAILTTDKAMKRSEARLPGGAHVVGVTKGSGMIHPNMATMLAFVMTDAKVEQDELRGLWQRVTDRSFNQLTVDGDTSTNDMSVVLASGHVDCDLTELEAALLEVCQDLARQIARDGEGATKLITVKVTGAATEADARAAAVTVASSSLVKTAVHGADPNWGRIVAAVGRAGVEQDMSKVRAAVQGFELFLGEPVAFDEQAVSNALTAEDVLIEVDLAVGSATAEAWGCDLSAEYVRINADYTT